MWISMDQHGTVTAASSEGYGNIDYMFHDAYDSFNMNAKQYFCTTKLQYAISGALYILIQPHTSLHCICT